MKKKLLLLMLVAIALPQLAMARVGDVNGDGSVTASDVTALYNSILYNDNSSIVNGDVNGDGEITASDVTAVYNIILYDIEPVPEVLVGGDISMITRYEERGATYFDKNGARISNILPWFKQQGWNAMRVRLFVNPMNASASEKGEGVIQDLDYIKALSKRIKDAGYALVLDLHYSDTWADPGKQTVPAAWKNASIADLKDSVYTYTKNVLLAMKDADATPNFIQLGNEITGGMLWPTGRIYPTGGAPAGGSWENFAGYQASAARAVREVSPSTKIILHVEMHNVNQPGGFFANCNTYGVEYDIMGLSYYSAYHGDFSKLNTTLTKMEAASSKPIMIMECGYGYAWELPGDNIFDFTGTYPHTNEGQQQFTIDMIAALKQHSQVKGLFWWWPEANEKGINWQNQVTTSWWNGSLFDNNTGKAQNALYELKRMLK